VVLPEDGAALVEEVFQVDHACNGVDEEADEVREGDVGDAVGCRRKDDCYLPWLSNGGFKNGAYLSRRNGGPFWLYSCSTLENSSKH
jgi:hypothetical protein